MRVDAREGARRILDGEVVGFQTETLYGLAVDPSNFSAVCHLSEIKSRNLGDGIPLIAASSESLLPWLAEETSAQLALRISLQNAFWPGPLTLVCATNSAAHSHFAPEVFGANFSLAARVSSGKIAHELATLSGGLVTATSANPHGKPPAKNLREFARYFPELAVIGTEEDCQSLVPSTIVSLLSGNLEILREGAIGSKLIFDCVQKG